MLNLPSAPIVTKYAFFLCAVCFVWTGKLPADPVFDSQAPVPVKPWRGIRSADSFGQECPSYSNFDDVEASIERGVDVEDCLNMNIFTPNYNVLIQKKRYPVMVYIHGGTFANYNAPDFRPDYIMNKDVVLVVINFRLDSLGKCQLAVMRVRTEMN